MHTNTHTKYLIRACILGIVMATTPALAQDAAPAAKSVQTSTSHATTTTDSQTPDAPDAAAENTTPATKSSPRASSIARWVQASGGRICRGLKINHKTRISRPILRTAEQGWRVSVPTFTHARLIRPPARSERLRAATTDKTTQPGSVETAVEPASDN